MSETIYENEHYVVMATDNAIGEDGEYGHEGYALVSRINGFVEGTAMLRPNIIFLAEQADGMMRQLEDDSEETEILNEIIEDVTPPTEH